MCAILNHGQSVKSVISGPESGSRDIIKTNRILIDRDVFFSFQEGRETGQETFFCSCFNISGSSEVEEATPLIR